MPTRQTVLSRPRRRCEHNSQSSRRLPTDSVDNLETDQTDSIAVWLREFLIYIDNFFNNDDIMTSLLKKLSISIKIGVIRHYGVSLVSFQIVDRIRRQSSWASCELCSHRWRRRDKRFVASALAVCTGYKGIPAGFVKPILGYSNLSSLSRKDAVVLRSLCIGHTHLTHSYLLNQKHQPQCSHCDFTLTVTHAPQVLSLQHCKTEILQRFYTEWIIRHCQHHDILGFIRDIRLYRLIKINFIYSSTLSYLYLCCCL